MKAQSPRPREVAARVVQRVIEDRAYSQRALAAELDRAHMHPGDRSFTARLVYGTLGHRFRIDRILDAALRKGLSSLSPQVRAILRVAAYQIVAEDPSLPIHAGVDEAVAELRRRHGKAMAGMGNAVLRRLARDQAAGALPPPRSEGEAWGIPQWMAELLIATRGADAEAAMAAFNAPSAVHLRITRDGQNEGATREAIVQALADQGVKATPHPLAPDGLVVRGGHAPGTTVFKQGRVVVQDAGAQLVSCAVPRESRRVLDACAGIGGKTRHLLERLPGAQVVATDTHIRKLDRLQRSAGDDSPLTVVRWTLPESPPQEVAEGDFDAIVLDAPCSALGTLGRHPEVRWTRTPAVLDSMAALQAQMLDAVVPLLAPNGVLVYAVCTWNPAEGVEQIARLLDRHPELVPDPPSAGEDGVAWPFERGSARGGGHLWPDLHDTDAFQLHRLRRGDRRS